MSAGLPPRQRAELRARTARPLTAAVEADRLAGWARACRSCTRPGHSATSPLVVLGVSEQPYGAATLTTLSEELAEGATNAVRWVVHDATHESLVSRREHAAEVVAAIRAVVTAADAAPATPTGTPRAARPARPR